MSAAVPDGAGTFARVYAWLAVTTLVAFLAWQLTSWNSADTVVHSHGTGHTPDFYVAGFSTTELDDNGQPVRELAARRLAHFPDTGASELVGPTLLLERIDGPPWRAWSEHGWLSADGDELLLQGRVLLWRVNADGTPRSAMLTENLRVLPETSYGETDAEVILLTRHGRTKGKGLRATLVDDRLELLDDVRTEYRRNRFATELGEAVSAAQAERAAVLETVPPSR